MDDRCHYYEQPRIIEQRNAYRRRMRTNRQEVVNLDETWANAYDGKDCALVERDDVTGETLGSNRRPPGKGARLIIFIIVLGIVSFLLCQKVFFKTMVAL